MKKKLIALPLMVLFFIISYYYISAAFEVEPKEAVVSEPAQKLNAEEQKKAAFEILKEILRLSDSPDRKNNHPQIKAYYHKIIDTYPDLALAQESYMRLVILAKEENTPEGDAEAEQVYQEFLQKYPGSRLKRVIENELRN